MKVVILCGGEGTRLREYTESIPKPLVEIGGKPILWHIMKSYSHFGFNDFILCLGYKGELIKRYFMDYKSWKNRDFTLKVGNSKTDIEYHDNDKEEWNISCVDTGDATNTGGRIKKIEKYIEDDMFFVTYGDGLADIDLNKLLDFHKKKGKLATITCVNPLSQFGVMEIKDELITEFKEKPPLNQWINGGFFVFNKKVFEFIGENDVLEKDPFEKLAKKKEISAFKTKGFWECMDTYKDTQVLNTLWKKNKAPWKVWK